MTPWEIKLLNGETAFFQWVDGFIGNHPIFGTLAIFYLLLLLLVLVIVTVARCRAEGLIQPGPRIIYIPLPTPPPEEPPFDPFPPMRERDYEYERFIDPDCRED